MLENNQVHDKGGKEGRGSGILRGPISRFDSTSKCENNNKWKELLVVRRPHSERFCDVALTVNFTVTVTSQNFENGA